MSKNVRRRGFTLAEVLVTITIVAVLAAVVVPAVLNQVNKGDNAALNGDIQALRTAVSNFTTDTRRYPDGISDLVGKPLTTEADLLDLPYGTAAINAWKGPYFPTSQDTVVIRSTGYNTAAFGLIIQSDFEAPSASNGQFITLVFTNSGFDQAIIANIDRLFDGGNGTVLADDGTTGCAAGTDGGLTGNLRWVVATAGTTCTVSAIKWRILSAAQ